MLTPPSLLLALSGVWSFATSSANAQAVFAHFMNVESYSFNVNDWTSEMTMAKGIGIDGFILNTALADYEVARTNDAFTAAESLGGFSLFMSFDMSANQFTSDQLVAYVANHSSSNAYYKWNGSPVVTTYCLTTQCIPNDSTYGPGFWSGFKSSLANQGIHIAFSPAFTYYRDPADASGLTSAFSASLDGFANWWSWPADTETNLTTDTDVAYMNAVANLSGPYIMGVSGWQFKDCCGGAWVEYSDYLWDIRWNQALQLKPDIVEIITWNDYGESHNIGDVLSIVAQDSNAALYSNMSHAGWRTMNQYYISQFKNNGTAPSVSGDTVVYWYREHAKDLTCSQLTQPRNYQFPADAVFVWALFGQDGQVQLDLGTSDHQTATISVSAGTPTMGYVNFSTDDGQSPTIQIIRGGSTVATGYGNVNISTQSCQVYNFNPTTGVITA